MTAGRYKPLASWDGAHMLDLSLHGGEDLYHFLSGTQYMRERQYIRIYPAGYTMSQPRQSIYIHIYPSSYMMSQPTQSQYICIHPAHYMMSYPKANTFVSTQQAIWCHNPEAICLYPPILAIWCHNPGNNKKPTHIVPHITSATGQLHISPSYVHLLLLLLINLPKPDFLDALFQNCVNNSSFLLLKYISAPSHPDIICINWDDSEALKSSVIRAWRFCKGKAVPLQAWSGPDGSRKLRFPDFKTVAQDGGKVVSPMHRPHLPLGNAPGTHFC